eukprot:3182178-Lingulodinium_polyedra.AAC.1
MAAGFRSSPAILTAAKASAVAAGHLWSQALDPAAREALRAAARGLGPPKHEAPVVLPASNTDTFPHRARRAF